MIPDDQIQEFVRAIAHRLAVPRPNETGDSREQEWLRAIAQIIAELRPGQHLTDAVSALCHEALESLDRQPRLAYVLARLTFELAQARGDAGARAESALAFATTHNRLGEFREALAAARQAARLFSEMGNTEQEGRSLLEAAWANGYIGELEQVQQDLACVRADHPSPLLAARCDWVEGRLARDQARYDEAGTLLARARDTFESAHMPLEAARCSLDLAQNDILGERNEPVLALDQLGEIFATTGCPLEMALCNYHKGDALWRSAKYVEALAPMQMAHRDLEELGSAFFVAWSQRSLGTIYRHLNRFDEALASLEGARDYFARKEMRSEISACDINLGSACYVLNRFDEAFDLYREAAEYCSGQDRQARLAMIYVNMGLVCIKQGRFSRALDQYHRARQIAEAKQLALLNSAIHAGLGICYRELGQYSRSLEYLKLAKRSCAEHHLHEQVIQCNIELASVLIALGRTGEGFECLQQARNGAAADNLGSLVAVCERLLAPITASAEGKPAALALLKNARARFLENSQVVDGALCDLTEGELSLAWNDVEAAHSCFAHAQTMLTPGYPDQAWRAGSGLARCAAASSKPLVALDHYLDAVKTISESRSTLPEQLSNEFFEPRQSVFDEALALACQQGKSEIALQVVEASKAVAFLSLLQQRGWKARRNEEDPYVASLVARERELRYQLTAMRGRLAVQAPQNSVGLFRSARELDSISAAALRELNALSQTYEAVVSQLQLAVTGLAGVSTPAPFALDTFRRVANRAYGSDWVALDYYVGAGYLTLLVVHPDHVEPVRKELESYDRGVLQKCTSVEPDLRELIYRRTLRGKDANSPGPKYLRHLYELLVPKKLAASTVIIAPHGQLHSLPFQTLLDGQTYLVEQRTLVYTPSLAVFQHLPQSPERGEIMNPLVLGVSQFGGQADPLAGALAEVEQLREHFSRRGQFWSDSEASCRRLSELNTTGELDRFDLVHFATHAVRDTSAPHQSRILLHDGALSALDIADLTLEARLVVLSACQTALGSGGSGDEIVGLARSFFFAGAHALMSTLWQVEDGSMTELIGSFYRHWAKEKEAAVALRQAQIELLRDGKSPYTWAPLTIMGRA